MQDMANQPTEPGDQADEMLAISRADYETLRAVAAAAVAASSALCAVARLQTTADGQAFEISVSDEVEGALDRAQAALGPMLTPEILAAIEAAGAAGAASTTAEAAA